MGKGDGHGMGSGLARGKTERVAVPAMPMWMAIICCILNFLIPGLGKETSDRVARNADFSVYVQSTKAQTNRAVWSVHPESIEIELSKCKFHLSVSPRKV